MDERARNRWVIGGGLATLLVGSAALIGWQVWSGQLPAPPPPPSPAEAPPRALGSVAEATDLHLPVAKRCLPPPGEVEGDEDMAASLGLAYEDVATSMRTFLPNTLRCMPDGGVEGTVMTSIVAGCDGRVSSVTVVDAGGLPPGFVECVKDTLRFVEFPAHDMPDGYEFDYPLTFSR